jgi:hypothetical protein
MLLYSRVINKIQNLNAQFSAPLKLCSGNGSVAGPPKNLFLGVEYIATIPHSLHPSNQSCVRLALAAHLATNPRELTSVGHFTATTIDPHTQEHRTQNTDAAGRE